MRVGCVQPQTSNVDEVLSPDSYASKMLPAEGIGLFGGCFLPLGGLGFSISDCLVLLIPCDTRLHVSYALLANMCDILFSGGRIEFDVLVIVGPSTCGTQAIHGGLDIVVAELADLQTRDISIRVKP